MFVHFFTVTQIHSNDNSIDSLYKLFGENIPKYLQYEGGAINKITCLFCVDANINIDEICTKNNYEYGTLYKIEINDDIYNNNYTVYPTYNRTGPAFSLQKNN